MAKTGQYGVVLFYSMSTALHTEKKTKRHGMTVKLIPVPRHLSSDCGVCLRFDQADEPSIRAMLEKEQIDIQGIYSL